MASASSQQTLVIAQLTLFVGAQFTTALQQHEYQTPTDADRASRREARRLRKVARRELLGILGADALRECMGCYYIRAP
jgi:hypothetical protein